MIGIFLYYIFSITPTSNFLLTPLETKYLPLNERDIKKSVITVLLLGGREADILRASEIIRIYNLQISTFNLAPKIIISGTDPLLPTSEEAIGVKKFFVSRGLKEENIIIEGQSRNTLENIKNVQKIVGKEPFFLVTSAYHMERAVKEFKKTEANPIPAPTDFKIKTEKYNLVDFLPNSQNLRNSDLALHEYFGILWYKIKNGSPK